MNEPLLTTTELTEAEDKYLRSRGYIALTWQPISETHRNLLGSDGKQGWQVLNRMLMKYRSAQDIEEVTQESLTTNN
jgi:hypothetical protein